MHDPRPPLPEAVDTEPAGLFAFRNEHATFRCAY